MGMERKGHLRPLGTLAPADRRPWSAADLDRSFEMPVELRKHISEYLKSCPVFLAWMEYTRDEIEDRFGVEGGSAIVSDGMYFWRMDAAAYVMEYGVALPEDAIRHFESLGWSPPVIDRERYLEIYQELDELLGGGEPVQ